MSDNSRVVWNEGMFLRPQHFQQQERSLLSQLHQSMSLQNAYSWGISDLDLDRALLANSRVGVVSLRAFFSDGTAVDCPTRDALPSPLAIDSSVRDKLVFLAVPIDKSNGLNAATHQQGITRYRIEDQDVVDTCVGVDATEVIQVAKIGLELKLESDNLAGYDTLAIARIGSVSEEGQVYLDEKFIPPSLDAQRNPLLKQYLNEFLGMLRQRAEALAARIGSGQSNASSIADFLMLQLLNRYDAMLGHVVSSEGLHPERLYGELAGMAGELATFSSRDKRAPELPVYQHDDLTRVFGELMVVLNQHMSQVLEQTAVQLPLEDKGFGIRVASVQDKGLLERADFVIAVQADINPEELRRYFPAQVKVGPVEHIRDLVNNSLPGIAAVSLPVAPRQVPYHAGYSYFKLDKSNDYWTRLSASGGIAIHLSGNYPDLSMQIWAINQ